MPFSWKSLVKNERFICAEERLEIEDGSRCDPKSIGVWLHKAESAQNVTSIADKEVGLVRKSQFLIKIASEK